MTKAPRLATTEEMLAIAAREDMAKSIIGTVAINLVRQAKPVSWSAIITNLERMAAGSDVLAKGALEFIATLPHQD